MSDATKKHILFASPPAFGHIIPLLELAKKVTATGDFHVTFAVSKSKIPDFVTRELLTSSDPIVLYGINDCVDCDLDDPMAKGALVKLFNDMLPGFADMLREMPTKNEPGKSAIFSRPVDVVVADNFLGAHLDICTQRGVPWYYFNSGTAGLTVFLLFLNKEWPIIEPEKAEIFNKKSEPGAPLAPVTQDFLNTFLPMAEHIHLAAGVIVNSFREIEQQSLSVINGHPRTVGKPAYCVGPLLPEEKAETSAIHSEMEAKVGQWLDRQAVNSVIYVSFGTVATPTPEQLLVIGQALLMIDRPFIWSLKAQFHDVLPAEIKSAIADQFDVPNCKSLVVKFAPQKLILNHDAVAVFVSHCGWNSTLEGLSGGKPIIGWPMFADQLENAELAASRGAGVVIPDTKIAGSRLVPAEEIVSVIETVVKAENGDEKSSYKKAAETWGKKIKATWSVGGSSYQEFQDLVASF